MVTVVLIYFSSFQSDWYDHAKDNDGGSKSFDGHSSLAYQTLVRQRVGIVSGKSQTVGQGHTLPTPGSRTTASSFSETAVSCGSFIRSAFRSQGLSEDTTEILLRSWSEGTSKQYIGYVKKWLQFCGEKAHSPIHPSVAVVLDFLTELFHKDKLGYSALNTARSALSAFVKVEGVPVGQHELVIRFMKGAFKIRPALPRYNVTWDVSSVLGYLKSLAPARTLSLLKLSQKLAMLLLLLSGQRGQVLPLLDIRNMDLNDSRVKFSVGDLVKQSKPGHHMGQIVIMAFAPDRRLCIVTVLKAYLAKTADIRGDETRLLLTTIKPYKAAARDTISRWIKQVMSDAGIDVGQFAPHSTRSAATSCAKRVQVPLDSILRTAGWKKQCVFRKYYDKPVSDESKFSTAILKTQLK